jgi:hypothetical protein
MTMLCDDEGRGERGHIFICDLKELEKEKEIL